jgi:hypothetical protein
MTEALTFSRQIDEVLTGKTARNFVLTPGYTLFVYHALGVPRLKLVMTQATLQKICQKHAVPISVLKQLPELLEHPVIIFKSATEADAVVAVLNATDKNGNAIIVAIHPDKQHKQHRVNLLASMYGKNRVRWFKEQIDKGRLLYPNKEKALRWSRSAQLQLPGEVTAARHIKNITQNEQEIKEIKPSRPVLTLKNKRPGR